MFIIIVFRLGSDKTWGLLFFRASFTSFHNHASLLTLFVCFFILSFLLFPCASVCEKTRLWFSISYGRTRWYLISSRDQYVRSKSCCLPKINYNNNNNVNSCMYKPQWCSDSIAYLRRLPPMWKREQKLVLLFGDYRSNLIYLFRVEGGWVVIFRIFKYILFFVNWISLYIFPFLIKYYHILFIIIVFRLGCDRPSWLLLFVPSVLFSILTPLFCPSLSHCLISFLLFPCASVWENTRAWVLPCPIAILNGTFLFREAK